MDSNLSFIFNSVMNETNKTIELFVVRYFSDFSHSGYTFMYFALIPMYYIDNVFV